ncbi:Hydrogenase maturation protease [uncultured archaeon]|nr:Hydrogenase maturation protease [uncultured archaeon]
MRLLKPFTHEKLKVFEGHTTPEAYIGPACASRPTHVLIVDAAELGQKPGTWKVLSKYNVEQGLFTTHTIPAVKIAAEIQRRCSATVVFVGIQPKSRDISLNISRECQKTAEEISEIIKKTMS